MGTWQYRVVRYGDDYDALITYDDSSVASLQAYAAANRELAMGLVDATEPVDVIVTFNQYLQPAQYRAWVASSGLSPRLTSMRFLTATGMRGTLASAPSADDPLPQSAIDNFLNDPSHPGQILSGVYAVSGTIPGNLLPGLLDDPLVFIPDVRQTVLRNDVADVVLDPSKIDHALGSPFWTMENLGLEHFR